MVPEEVSGKLALDDQFSSVTERIKSLGQNIALRIESEDIPSMVNEGAREIP
jgi:hypothetical protein